MVREQDPSPIDVQVGANIRNLRVAAGLSQEKLGEALGLTFQQVQKYEKGTNRVSASKLWAVSEFLHVKVEVLFAGVGTQEGGIPAVLNHTTVSMAKTFEKLSSRQRKVVMDLLAILDVEI